MRTSGSIWRMLAQRSVSILGQPLGGHVCSCCRSGWCALYVVAPRSVWWIFLCVPFFHFLWISGGSGSGESMVSSRCVLFGVMFMPAMFCVLCVVVDCGGDVLLMPCGVFRHSRSLVGVSQEPPLRRDREPPRDNPKDQPSVSRLGDAIILQKQSTTMKRSTFESVRTSRVPGPLW
jgi:hypothetical protein